MDATRWGFTAWVLLTGTVMVMVAGCGDSRDPKQPLQKGHPKATAPATGKVPRSSPRSESLLAPHLGNVAAKVTPPKYGIIQPDNTPPRSLHRLGSKPFRELAMHKLTFPWNASFEQLSDPVWFRRKAPKQAVSYVRWQLDKGFVPLGQPPPDLVPRIKRSKQGVEIAQGGSTVYVPLPGPPQPIVDGLINGGRSLVLLQPHLIGTSIGEKLGQTIPILLFMEKLNQKKPVVMKVPLGRASVLVTAPEAKVFYLATGPIQAPDVLYRVDPFRGTYRRVVGTNKMRCDGRCWFLHQEQLLIENPSHDDFVILFDLKRNRERLLRLPNKSDSLLVIRRPGKRTLLAVGDQLIDPVRARIIGKLPKYSYSCASVFDAKRERLYYAVTYGIECTTIQAYDVAKRKLIGSVMLKSMTSSTHLRHGPPPAVEHLFLLPDGSVLAIRS